MDFVFVSLQRINTDRESTSTSLAKELAKNHRVLYINSPIDRRTYYSKKNDSYTQAHIQNIKNGGPKLTQANKNLWVLNPSRVIESINWIPFTPVFSFFNWFNNTRLAKDIKEATDTLGFKNYIIINDKDIFRSFYLKDILKPEKYIYLDRDYTIGMDYWKRHGVALEPKLMEKSDGIVCNSTDFTNRAKQYNPNSYYIGNGFDASLYSAEDSSPIPKDLVNIPGPIIGYVGALITLRLNLNLLIKLAKERPNWSFVLIGWEDDEFQKSDLHSLENVYMLGRKHTKEVPTYIKHFDVCLNPQVVNEITIGNFPLKIVEYLALGKPVVATATNTMKEVFSEHTYLANDNAEDYAKKIEQALQEDNVQLQNQRRLFCGNFSWESVTNVFLKVVKKLQSSNISDLDYSKVK